MRDIALTLIIVAVLPMILRQPHVGVLVWSWLSYMNPHRLTWGFAYTLPWAQIVAITLFISLLLDKERKRLPSHFLIVVWILFILWAFVTSLNAYYPDFAMPKFIELVKIQLIIFITMLVMHSAERINMMIWVIYLSIGFYGFKGGIFAVVTGGAHIIWGPAGTFIGDNNHLAVALLMILPLGYYLVKHQVQHVWVRRAMWISMFFITLSVVASFSRGAFLAIICVAFYLWMKSNKKIMTMIFVIPILPMMFLFMPESWHERMATIETYEEDASAMSRINSWRYAINAANDNVTGVGMNAWRRETFAMYAPDPTTVFAAHSIYFSVIADHGWIGFAMWLTIYVGAFRIARRIVKVTRPLAEYAWVNDLAKMIQVSLVAYATGGAFLSLSYYDLPWHLVAIILLLQQLLKTEGVWPVKSRAMAPRLQGTQS